MTSVDLVAALVERIEAVDHSGPTIRSVLRLNESAADEAAQLDSERRAGHVRGPLHGIPVLVKDNIDTAGLASTAGSLVLDGNPPSSDAPLVTRLREAGLVIIGKTNLSEWANFRGRPSASGWSAVGNQTRNPFALNRSPGGSSAGSGAALAAGLAPLAIGTETDGSILCPAAACGLVGLKPTVGLVSRTGIIPVAASQDSAGPMARSVADAARLLDVLAGGRHGPPESVTAGRPERRLSFEAALSGDLRGLRIGVVRDEGYFGYDAALDAVVETTLHAFTAAGAELVDPVTGIGAASHADEMTVLCHEFKAGLEAYLAGRRRGLGDGRARAGSHAGGSAPAAGESGRGSAGESRAGSAGELPRRLADVIAFNEACEAERLDVFAQDVLIRAAATAGLDDPEYVRARDANHRRTRLEGIDAVCLRLRLDALVAPTMSPAWPIDYITGDRHAGAAWGQAAVAGYPSLSLPIGELRALPIGMTIWGRAWTEATILRIAGAVEDQINYRPAPSYAESLGLTM